jgi:hypothetical protein
VAQVVKHLPKAEIPSSNPSTGRKKKLASMIKKKLEVGPWLKW